uniref:hypothetical protein n=1 Tax=Burkholderia cepacia TaxID=292 RepID=UPI002ABDA5F9
MKRNILNYTIFSVALAICATNSNAIALAELEDESAYAPDTLVELVKAKYNDLATALSSDFEFNPYDNCVKKRGGDSRAHEFCG